MTKQPLLNQSEKNMSEENGKKCPLVYSKMKINLKNNCMK